MNTLDSFFSAVSLPIIQAEVSPGIVYNWQPTALPGKQLLEWSMATAEVATIRHLACEATPQALSNLVSEIQSGLKHAIDCSKQRACRECDAGCADCCHVMIAVTAPEVFAIADYLRANNTTAQIQQLQQHAEAVFLQTINLNHEQYAAIKVECPLLSSENRCNVYPVRPLRCQAWYSLSAERCRNCFTGNSVDETVPLDAHAYTVGQGIGAGISAGLRSLGLDGNFYELGSALAAVLPHADAAAKWLAGENVLQGCKPYH